MNEFKSFKQIPVPVGQPAKPVSNRDKIKIYQERGTGRVVDDPRLEIKWKPIDKVASRVVAAATGYNKPPRPAPIFNPKPPPNNMPAPKEETAIHTPGAGRLKTKTQLTEDGHRETMIDLESLAPAALDEHERTVKKGAKAAEELLEKSRDVIASIDYLASEIRGPWTDFEQYVKQALTTVREQRIALGSETRLLMGALKEVRQFFLDSTYETEIQRLHEFIDVCERLKAMKDSGFLDNIADTILKLDSRD